MAVTYAKVVVEDSSAHIAQTSAKADQLNTARTIGGVSFNGTANITLPGVNSGGNQDTTGASAQLKTAGAISLTGDVISSSGVTYTNGGNVAVATSISSNKIAPANLKGPLTNALGNGSSGQVLKSAGNGTFQWGTAGGVTEVTVGTGLDVSSGTTTPNVTLDLSEVADGTADVVGSADELIYLDDGTQKRKAINEIKLGQFSNDQSWTANAGTVTSVGGGKGMSGTVTGSGNLDFAPGSLADIGTFSPGSALSDADTIVVYDDSASEGKTAGFGNIPLSFFNNDSGFTTNVGDITGVTAGTGMTGGGTSAGVTLNVIGGTGVTANANDIAIGQAVGTSDNVTFANMTLSGDLTVQGTTITTNTETLEIGDNKMILNAGHTGGAVDTGLMVERGSSGDNQFLFWDESVSSWAVGNGSSTSFPTASSKLAIQKTNSSFDNTDASVPVGSMQVVGSEVYIRQT